MKFVIDTSVAVKWFLPEVDHDTAVALLETKATFLAPDLIFTEFATAMQKKIKLGESRHDQARESCTSLPGLFASITPTLLLFQRALDIGVAMAHPVQDCIFLACAEQEGVPVVSADRKLIAKASERGFGQFVFGMDVAIEAANAVPLTAAIPDTELQNILRLNARVDTTFGDLRALGDLQSGVPVAGLSAIEGFGDGTAARSSSGPDGPVLARPRLRRQRLVSPSGQGRSRLRRYAL